MTAPATDLAITLDPQHAPVNVARMIQWLKDHPSLEVGAWRPGRHILLTEASGTATSAWRSEESTAPVTRGTIVIPQVQRDALQASMLILLADAPELDERVTVVGRVDQSSLSQLDQLLLGDLISARTP